MLPELLSGFLIAIILLVFTLGIRFIQKQVDKSLWFTYAMLAFIGLIILAFAVWYIPVAWHQDMEWWSKQFQ